MRPYILAESNYLQLKEAKIDLAVLPWGATEAHNYHLPYATDNIQIEHIAAEAGRLAWEKGARLTVLPCIPFGVNTGQPDILLDMNLNPTTQLAILADLVEVLNRQGIYKLLILNGHGGNDFKNMLRELGLRFPKMFLSTCNWFRAIDMRTIFELPGDHADEMETSLMLHLRPELVLPLSRAGAGKENRIKIPELREGWAWTERKWSLATADTGVGDPALSTREKGEKLFQTVTEKIAGLMYNIASADLDDLYEK